MIIQISSICCNIGTVTKTSVILPTFQIKLMANSLIYDISTLSVRAPLLTKGFPTRCDFYYEPRSEPTHCNTFMVCPPCSFNCSVTLQENTSFEDPLLCTTQTSKMDPETRTKRRFSSDEGRLRPSFLPCSRACDTLSPSPTCLHTRIHCLRSVFTVWV